MNSMLAAIFIGPNGTFATLPTKVLLFRDNVQHHLQEGCRGPGYRWIHELADGVVGLSVARPPACELWDELSLAFAGIEKVLVRDLAVNANTGRELSGVRGVRAVRGTILLRQAGWGAPIPLDGANTLGELFSDIMRGFERITLSGNGQGGVEIARRFGHPGSFARATHDADDEAEPSSVRIREPLQ